MASTRERNDRKPRFSGGGRPRADRAPPPPEGCGWIWGVHAAEAALANPERTIRRVLSTPERTRSAQAALRRRAAGGGPAIETIDAGALTQSLPAGAVHGGMALLAEELPDPGLEALAQPAEGVILVLDQVTDPQNVGALLRSAAAFGARGVVMQQRHSPALFGALAKAAAGAVDRVPVAHVVNIARALEALADAGWRSVGLDGGSQQDLAEATAEGGPLVLVMGSEGEGLRRLVAEHCDTLARIPMPGGLESLNVSAAGAVALYQATRDAVAHPRGERG